MRRLPLLVAALALASAARAGTPVAFVADVSGTATIAGDGKLDFLAQLEAGQRIYLGSHARASITFAASGDEYRASGPGEFVVGETALTAEKGGAPVHRHVDALQDPGVVARVTQSATASLRMRGVQPERNDTALVYPRDGRIANLQPHLRWNGSSAAGYAVSVHDANGREIWRSTSVASGVLVPVKLAPAAQYRWRVMDGERVVGEAGFETLPAKSLARIEKSRIAAKTFPARVMHAFLLQEQGAEQDAREAWSQLAGERPDLPELAALARGAAR